MRAVPIVFLLFGVFDAVLGESVHIIRYVISLVLFMAIRYLCFLFCFILIASANANEPILKNDPKRPVDKISKDLGISPDQFVNCFNNVNPTPGGARPESADRVRANKRVLLPCLQEANPNITNDWLDEVMDRYRPGGRKAQEPMK